MKRGTGTSGYEGYIIELKVHCPSAHNRGLMEAAVFPVIPNQQFGDWKRGTGCNIGWVSLMAGPVGHKPEELYWKVCRAIWAAIGYCSVQFEARPVVVQTGWYASSEPEDLTVVSDPPETSARCYSDHDEDIRTKGSCDYCRGITPQGAA